VSEEPGDDDASEAMVVESCVLLKRDILEMIFKSVWLL